MAGLRIHADNSVTHGSHVEVADPAETLTARRDGAGVEWARRTLGPIARPGRAARAKVSR